jgi:hypothetical protein
MDIAYRQIILSAYQMAKLNIQLFIELSKCRGEAISPKWIELRQLTESVNEATLSTESIIEIFSRIIEVTHAIEKNEPNN